MDIFNIPVVWGTARQGRLSAYVERLIIQQFTEHNVID